MDEPHVNTPADESDAEATETATGTEASAVEPATPPRRKRRWLRRSLQVLAGLLIGLVLTELLFWWRDDGAFPRVNLYIADEQLGVRLEPNSEQRFKLGSNPLTHIRINRHGYRGANFPATSENEILVVGDSQVFGLGVEEDETFSARLAELTGRTVINGGVPTYGPLEYTAVARELLPKRNITTVVYTINFVNDLFENERPNRDRHEVWDGWTVRSETAPKDVFSFPGRRWLMSRSHAVYALRRWLQDSAEKTHDRGFESEGTWEDLVATGERISSEHRKEVVRTEEHNQAQVERLRQVEDEIRSADSMVRMQAYEVLPELRDGRPIDRTRYRAGFVGPGDILSSRNAEASRPLVYTARLIQQGVRYREQIHQDMVARAARDEEEAQKYLEAHAHRDALVAEYNQLHSRALRRAQVPSVLLPRLREIAELCAQNGAELVVLALPIDVQVSADEWQKYGVTEPLDMEPSKVLIDDLMRSSESLGARALDTTPALAAVTEHAFLDADIHMTPAGHRAVADALASKLDELPPLLVPALSLPADRTRIPLPGHWQTALAQPFTGSEDTYCASKRVAEWLRVTCQHKGKWHVPSDIEIETGGRGEAMTVVTEHGGTLLTPIFPGDEVRATFYWTTGKRALTIAWATGQEAPTLAFSALDKNAGRPLAVATEVEEMCRCYARRWGDRQCRTDERSRALERCRSRCTDLYTAPSAECLATYKRDCYKVFACTRGDLSALPTCPEGQANATATGQCRPLCDASRPCATGVCTPWQGGHVCL